MELKDADKLQNYLIENDSLVSRSLITNYPTYGLIYKWTNENFKLYPSENLEGKKILIIVIMMVLRRSRNYSFLIFNYKVHKV